MKKWPCSAATSPCANAGDRPGRLKVDGALTVTRTSARPDVDCAAAARQHAPRRGRAAKPAGVPHAPQRVGRHPADAAPPEILSAAEFAVAVEHEKRRSERSGEPLSMLLCGLDAKLSRHPGLTQHVLDTLSAARRNTDLLGCLGAGRFALLCPNTGDAVLPRFRRVMTESAGIGPLSLEVVTYPDDLFEVFATTAPAADGNAPKEAHAFAGGSRGYPLKRFVDVSGALLGIALLWPLMLLVWAAVRLTSSGPAIFRQKRLGRGGVPFTFYKFRSMRTGASEALHRDFVSDFIRRQGDTVACKIKGDPRVTGCGRFLRKTSIDELPQLFNVLKGDMSLVGPRPPIAYEAANYQPWHLRRILEVKPGITGLWQVKGRSKVSFDDMVRMDIQYVRCCCLTYDLRILLKTVLVVLRCDGAY